MKRASSSLLVRLARLAWPHRNPLARGVDRLESTMLVLVVLAGLLLLPVMLTWGSVVHGDMAAASESQARTRHTTVATLTRDASESNAVATWSLPDGTTATGRVNVSDGLKAGTKVEIWLDRDGRVVDRPLSDVDAAVGGAMVALAGWLAAVVLLVFAYAGAHFLLERCRYRAWDRQWERVASGWNNYRR